MYWILGSDMVLHFTALLPTAIVLNELNGKQGYIGRGVCFLWDSSCKLWVFIHSILACMSICIQREKCQIGRKVSPPKPEGRSSRSNVSGLHTSVSGDAMLVAGPRVGGRLLAGLVDQTMCGSLVAWNNPNLQYCPYASCRRAQPKANIDYSWTASSHTALDPHLHIMTTQS